MMNLFFNKKAEGAQKYQMLRGERTHRDDFISTIELERELTQELNSIQANLNQMAVNSNEPAMTMDQAFAAASQDVRTANRGEAMLGNMIMDHVGAGSGTMAEAALDICGLDAASASMKQWDYQAGLDALVEMRDDAKKDEKTRKAAAKILQSDQMRMGRERRAAMRGASQRQMLEQNARILEAARKRAQELKNMGVSHVELSSNGLDALMNGHKSEERPTMYPTYQKPAYAAPKPSWAS